jgi:hypothetical protein
MQLVRHADDFYDIVLLVRGMELFACITEVNV